MGIFFKSKIPFISINIISCIFKTYNFFYSALLFHRNDLYEDEKEELLLHQKNLFHAKQDFYEFAIARLSSAKPSPVSNNKISFEVITTNG